jgi:hypothetical protein
VLIGPEIAVLRNRGTEYGSFPQGWRPCAWWLACWLSVAAGASAQVNCDPFFYTAYLGPYNGFRVFFHPFQPSSFTQNGELQLPPNWTEATIEVWQATYNFIRQSTFHIAFDEGSPNNIANRVQAHVPWNFDDLKVYWDFGDFNGAGRLSYTPSVDHRSWQHYAFIASQTGNADRSGPFMRIYRNGVLEAEKLSSDAVDTRPGGFYGPSVRLGGLGGYNFSGDVAEFRIWTVARTQAEIQRDWKGMPSGDGLLLHWRFAEGSGTTTADLSGNGNSGIVLTGTPFWYPIGADTGSFGTLDPCRAPQITLPPQQPTEWELCTTEAFEIRVDAEPAADVVSAYQWLRDGADLPGQTEKTLRIPALSAKDFGLYSIRATNEFNPALLTVTEVARVALAAAPPLIDTPITSVTVCPDAPLHLSATATGRPLTYQ